MRISRLTIENFRGFAGASEIAFPEGNLCVIIGKNGGGKSSITDVLAACGNLFFWTATSVKFQAGRQLRRKDIHRQANRSQFRLSLDWKDVAGGIVGALSLDETFGGHLLDGGLEEAVKAAYQNREALTPLFLHYATDRRQLPKDALDHAFAFVVDPRMAYADVTYRDFSETLFTHFFNDQINQENAAKVNRQDLNYELPYLKLLRQKLAAFLKNFFGRQALIALKTVSDRLELVLELGDDDLLLSQLSSGEKFIVSFVLDICTVLIRGNGLRAESLEAPGIVVIDEIEQHLHPDWQAKIVPALTQTFPNLQFIVTTHSPLVINQVKHDNIIVLDDFRVTPGTQLRETYGMDVNGVLNSIMGAPLRPQAVRQKFSAIGEALEAGQIEQAKNALRVLKREVDPDDPEILALEDIVPLYENEKA